MTFQPVPHPAGAAQIRPEMTFSQAAEVYMGSRTFVSPSGEFKSFNGRYIRSTTVKNYKNYVRSLALFFGNWRLSEIRLDHLRQYQQARVIGAPPFNRFRRPQDAKPTRAADGTMLPPKGPGPCPTKPQHVNQELCMLRSILRRATVWDATFDDYYEELQEPESEMPRALSPDEERKWLEVSASQQRWQTVHWYSLLALGTCMSTNEIRTLRLRDVNLPAQVLTVSVEGSKNRYRHRTIPLRETSTLWAVEQLISRAQWMGAREPDHYIFPFCSGHVPDVRRPMTVQGLKKPWQEVRDATGLMSFRMYDTRHTAITRLAEEGVPITVIMSLAGHISPRMTLHYTHVSDQGKIIAMRKANQSRFGAAENLVPSPIASLLPAAGSQLLPPQQARMVASQNTHNTTTTASWTQSSIFFRGRRFGF